MQPAEWTLRITRGEVLRQPVLLSQSRYAYKAISQIQKTAPLRLKVPNHGLPEEWPVWVEDAAGWLELTQQGRRGPSHRAERVDADTLEINRLNGINRSATGGVLVFNAPVDLTGCSARLLIQGPDGSDMELTTENGGIQIQGFGALLIHMTPVQTLALLWSRGCYVLTVTLSDGETRDWLKGDVQIGEVGVVDCGAVFVTESPVTATALLVAAQGIPGPPGKSAYELWLDAGNTGSEQDFIDSLGGGVVWGTTQW